MRAVLDTNIVVSAALCRNGNEAEILRRVMAGKLDIAASPAILVEYEDVLTRPKLGLDPRAVQLLLKGIYAAAIVVEPSIKVAVSADNADNRFLECAQAIDADYLVTGNRRHFPRYWRRTRVVSSRELLRVLGAV